MKLLKHSHPVILVLFYVTKGFTVFWLVKQHFGLSINLYTLINVHKLNFKFDPTSLANGYNKCATSQKHSELKSHNSHGRFVLYKFNCTSLRV